MTHRFLAQWFHGSFITSSAGALAYRELNNARGLSTILADARNFAPPSPSAVERTGARKWLIKEGVSLQLAPGNLCDRDF